VDTQKSSFFYKSNLVNISLLFKCFYYDCLENREPDNFHIHKEHLTSDPNILHSLCKKLLYAYKEFDLPSIRDLYNSYIRFYHAYLVPITPKQKYSIIILAPNYFDTEINDKTVYPYLSCILSSNQRFFNFEGTRIIIAHIGMSTISTDGFHTSIMIAHDWTFHQQYHNKKYISYADLINIQNFFLKLYSDSDIDKTMRNKIIDLLWFCYYEQGATLLVNTFVKLIGELHSTKHNFFLSHQLEHPSKHALIPKDFEFDITKDKITYKHLEVFNAIKQNLDKEKEDENYNHKNYDIPFFLAFYKFMLKHFPPDNQILIDNVKILLHIDPLLEGGVNKKKYIYLRHFY